MRLMRVGPSGEERPVALVEGRRVDLRGTIGDFDQEFFGRGGISELRSLISQQLDDLPEADPDLRVGPPVSRPRKLVCIGLNYSDHATESGMSLPEEPTVFFKAPNTIVGPNDNVLIPPESGKTDWEVELAIVIGRHARYLRNEKETAEVIAGYTISNDISERHYQLERGGQWVKGKSCETFNPLGPWLVTPDELDLEDGLKLRLTVNGELMQDGNTDQMVFGPTHIVMYLSQFMVLEPGDVINTGTPAGVGLGQHPPRFLHPGDRIELWIDGLGGQSQVCQQASR